jgi:excisionase family DNA binding protein
VDEIAVGDETLDLLTIPEVMARTRLSRSTVKRLIASGELKSILVRRRRRIAPEALAEWKKSLGGGTRLVPEARTPQDEQQ